MEKGKGKRALRPKRAGTKTWEMVRQLLKLASRVPRGREWERTLENWVSKFIFWWGHVTLSSAYLKLTLLKFQRYPFFCKCQSVLWLAHSIDSVNLTELLRANFQAFQAPLVSGIDREQNQTSSLLFIEPVFWWGWFCTNKKVLLEAAFIPAFQGLANKSGLLCSCCWWLYWLGSEPLSTFTFSDLSFNL